MRRSSPTSCVRLRLQGLEPEHHRLGRFRALVQVAPREVGAQLRLPGVAALGPKDIVWAVARGFFRMLCRPLHGAECRCLEAELPGSRFALIKKSVADAAASKFSAQHRFS